jgi:hypothetical protein
MSVLPASLSFPAQVNEKAARVVAAVVAVAAVVVVVAGWFWLSAVLAVGFLLRVLAGPRWSPLARVAVGVVAPRLGPPRLVPGPPKRFAQAIGLVVTTSSVVAVVLGATEVATVLMTILAIFASLEAVVGFCAGCWMFGVLMRIGVVPDHVCQACADLRLAPSTLTRASGDS